MPSHPVGDYRPVSSVSQLLEELQASTPSVKYLELTGDLDVFNISREGLNPAAFTINIILCNGHTINLLSMMDYPIQPSSELQLYSCILYDKETDTPLAERTTLTDCVLVRPCKSVPAGLAESNSGTESLNFQINRITRATKGGFEETLIHSNVTCSGLASGASSTDAGVSDTLANTWPFMVLAIAFVIIGVLVVAVLMLRRRSIRLQRSHASERWKQFGSTTVPANTPSTSRASQEVKSHTPTGNQHLAQCRSQVASQCNPGISHSVSQTSVMEDSSCRGVGSINPTSPQATSDCPPGTPGTPPGTSISSINSDLTVVMNTTIAQFKKELPDVPVDILQHIGSGGYGNVYRGMWKGLEVAIKTIVFQDRGYDGTADRVIKEAAIACNMSNDHVVNTFTHELKRMPAQVPGELVDYKLYIIQEFCIGGSLAKLLTGEYLVTSAGGVHIMRVLKILRDVANGMAYMHNLHMVHGDLNPSNIFLQLTENKYIHTPRKRKKSWKPLTKEAARGLDDGSCIVKLGDFGLTVQLHGGTHVSNITHGTPFYSAPELASQGHLRYESDVYSFGVLMWEMYHNDTPYDIENDNFIMNQYFGRFSSTAPLNFAVLAVSCLAANPEERPTFAQIMEFLAAIGLELNSGYYTDMQGHTQVQLFS